MKNMSVRKMAFCAVIAAVYAALTMALAFMSFGNIQLRIAEALCILPFFFPSTTWGLFLGCLIANLMSPVGAPDIILGTLATLLSCLCTSAIGAGGSKRSWPRCIGACLMPVVWNSIIIGAMLAYFSSPVSIFVAIPLFAMYAIQVAIGEAVVMFAIGLPLMRSLPNKKYFEKLGDTLK